MRIFRILSGFIGVIFFVLILLLSCTVRESRLSLGKRGFLFIRSHIAGSHYSAGSAWARLITSNTDFIGVNSTIHASENDKIRLLVDGDIQVAFLKGPEANLAYRGDPVYWKDSQPIHALISLWPKAYTLVALKNSGIENVPDIKGKRIAIYSYGSVTGDIFEYFLNLYGINETNTVIYRVRDIIGIKMLTTGETDCIWYDLGYGEHFLRPAYDSALDTYADKNCLNLVPINTDEKVREFLKVYPFFYIDMYGKELGLQDRKQFMTTSFTACSADMPEETAYMITRLWWENWEHVRQYVPGMLDLINVNDNRKGVPLPFHKGAVKYLKEASLIPVP